MSKTSRKRRNDTRRRHETGRPGAGSTGSATLRILSALIDAARAPGHRSWARLLADFEAAESLDDQPRVNALLAEQLLAAVRDTWAAGWQPLDVVRMVTKHYDAACARLAALVVLADAVTTPGDVEVPELWQAQLDELRDQSGRHSLDGWLRGSGPPGSPGRGTAVRAGVTLLGALAHIPPMPHLLPPPNEWRATASGDSGSVSSSRLDDRMLDKIRALLAKAESTNFEDEATALTGKAQELMARYAIDEALVARPGDGPGARPGSAVGRRIRIDDPYAMAKFTLLARVGDANRCTSVWSKEFGFADVFGAPTDLEIVDVLYTSLLVQGTTAMLAAGQAATAAQRRTRSFRQSFLISFAVRIGERLKEATATTADDVSDARGASVLPVLASRAAAAEEAAAKAHPHTRAIRAKSSNYDGMQAGRTAAERADVGRSARVGPSTPAGSGGVLEP